ncbi:hypothetical protein JJB07_02560 [Tumebacillus sp. ITR2]|uniref:Uncharacterized protein n=1 Tax=Tumebacillus amylolyticus TaxID=2801339 RepID=A0ABS1J5T3_9BACL|nr:hypothetical protein [Tumebacillus amylolyticus]MBL0385520.1 hypothetical protein [Tumebacillus amylolyticus]
MLGTELKAVASKFYRMEINSAVQDLNRAVDLVGEFVSEAISQEKLSSEQLQDVNQTLSLIMDCLQNDDYILVADLFQHELAPLIEELG